MSIVRFVAQLISSIHFFFNLTFKRLWRLFRPTNLLNFFSGLSIKILATQAVCVCLIVTLLTNTTLAMASPQGIFVSATEMSRDFSHSWQTSGLATFFSTETVKSLINKFSDKNKQKRIDRIVILPTAENNTLTIRQGAQINFTAIALQGEQPLGGVLFEWSVTDTYRKRPSKPMNNGRFESKIPGTYIIVAATQGLQAQVNVTVLPNDGIGLQRLLQKEENAKTPKERQQIEDLKAKGNLVTREINSKNGYNAEQEKRRGDAFKAKLREVDKKQRELQEKYPNPFQQPGKVSENRDENQPEGINRADAEGTVDESKLNPEVLNEKINPVKEEAEPGTFRPADEQGWSDDNWWSADDPENQTGNPPGTSPDAGAGNGNFQFSAPIVALAGRGMDVNLSLNYNSRLWGKSGNTVYYDPDKGFPAPGWNLGFGKMMFMGTNGGCMLVDADGTRRSHAGTTNTYTSGNTFSTHYYGHTTDGSFISYSCNYYYFPTQIFFGGEATLPNGVKIAYYSNSSTSDQAFPTSITDTQGNYLTITYQNNIGPNISTVTDTMGRVVTFNYDGANRLVSVSVPGFNGGSPRTAVRIHYKNQSLNYGFASGIAVDTNNSSPYLIDAIFYPGTNTGYWFNDSDSYSGYGMIAKIKEMRGMTWSGSSNNDQGTITQGTTSKQSVYDYPLTPNYSLTDAPTYSNLTESWDGMDTAPAVTNYLTYMNASPRTVTVTQPNGVKNKQYMYNAPNAWNDNLIYQDETLDASNNVLNKSVITWELGDYSTPRPTRTEVTDERNQMRATDISYYGGYNNQVTSKKEYDYNGSLAREIKTEYENYYASRNMFYLVKSNEIYDGNGNRLARTEYEYDNNAIVNGVTNHNLKATPGVVQHNYWMDPYTTHTQDGSTCLSGGFQNIDCAYEGQNIYLPEGYDITCEFQCWQYEQVSAYQPYTLFRGNITKITGYTDAANLTSPIVENRQYDVTGNLVAQSNSANEAATINYDVSTQYAYPVSQTEGAADPNSPLRNISSAVHDFNTGLVKQTTNKNGRTNTVTIDANSLRATTATSSTGSYQQMFYDDAAMTVTEESHEYGGNLASKNIKYLDGAGQLKKEETLGLNNTWDITETKYTNLGQVWKKSRPYRTGDTVQWTENIYDIQGRVSQVLEADGSVVQAFYNETSRPGSASNLPGQTIRTVDAWGRERWERYDKDNKLVEIVEPDPNGNGSVFSTGTLATKYVVDTLGRLVETEQGSQHRYFKYNSLGLLTHQKLAEKNASLNDAGQFVGGNNGQWSDVFVYDNRANLIQRIDARGVKTNHSYQISGVDDPLNRIQQVSYDKTGADTSKPIADASTVNFTYAASGDQKRILQTSTAWTTETNTYDTEGRISDYTITFPAGSSQALTTSYTYDSLDRITEIRYPAAYGMASSPRKVVATSYDAASRLLQLKVDNQTQMNEIVYNPLDQITSVKIGEASGNADVEQYTYDAQTGLLTNQKVIKANTSQTLLDLSYEYNRGSSLGSVNGKTGSLTQIINNLDRNKDKVYEYDAIGRLKTTKGGGATGVSGVTANWTQNYTYDRYGNRTNVAASGITQNSQNVPIDGIAGLSYDQATNRVNTSGYEYDLNGNLTRGQAPDGSWQRYEYDSAGRLNEIKDDAGNSKEGNGYTSSNKRLVKNDGTKLTWYVWEGDTVIAEYTSTGWSTPLTWAKSYINAGSNLLSTYTNNNSGGEILEYQHPDRLGTKLVTNHQANTGFEQSTLPFGTSLDAETSGTTNRQFTTYDRGSTTKMDYAVNRHYSSALGRFTQVDPIGMNAVDLRNAQTLNLYSYCANDPINHTDSDGLFFGFLKKLFNWLGKALKWIALAVAVVALILVTIAMPAGAWGWAYFFQFLGAAAAVAEQIATLAENKILANIFGIIGAVASFGTGLITGIAEYAEKKLKAILGVIKAGATLAGKILTVAGYEMAGKILGFASAVAGAISDLKFGTQKDFWGKDLKIPNYKSAWEWFKTVRGLSQQIATLAGAKDIAAILGNFGLIEDVTGITQAIGAMKRGFKKATPFWGMVSEVDSVKTESGPGWTGVEQSIGKTLVANPRASAARIAQWLNATKTVQLYLVNTNNILKSLNTINGKINAK